MRPLAGRKILLGVTGGIAAYKAPELLRLLQSAGAEVRVMLTSGAEAFVSPLVFEALTRHKVYTQEDFLRPQRGEIPHTDWGSWAEAVVVAPATASFLAGLAQGDATSILTATIMASKAKVLLCPAMNQHMLAHPATQENLRRLRSFGYEILSPDSGSLACGQTGPGRLPEPQVIKAWVARLLSPRDLWGTKVIVTAGPTREPIDQVRYISNRSSGRMGVALAQVAWFRGAEVSLVHGPLSVPLPVGPKCLSVESVYEMLETLLRLWKDTDILVMAAAVADFVVKDPHAGKIKKTPSLTLTLKKAPDILQTLREKRRPGQILVGFAAEEGAVLKAEASRKLKEKGLDLIVANDITRKDTGFDTETNEVLVLDRFGGERLIPKAPKEEIAWAIWDEVLRVRRDVSV